MLMTAMRMDSSSSTSPPPWLPVHAQHHYHDFTASAPSPSPSPTPVTAAPSHHHIRAAPSSRRIAKRRPRPSRRLPTTYISADPASFRRMVQQVTGADPQPSAEAELLHRPAPARAGTLNMLPTLDTSAFLLARTGTDAPSDGPAAVQALESEAGGVGNANCGGFFPTLGSWDALL